MNEQIEKLCIEYIEATHSKPLTTETKVDIHFAYEAGFLKACELQGLVSLAAMLPSISKAGAAK